MKPITEELVKADASAAKTIGLVLKAYAIFAKLHDQAKTIMDGASEKTACGAFADVIARYDEFQRKALKAFQELKNLADDAIEYIEQSSSIAIKHPTSKERAESLFKSLGAQDTAATRIDWTEQELANIPMRYDPVHGHYFGEAQITPKEFREQNGTVAWLYNPYTGKRRNPRDIGSDVTGLLLSPKSINDNDKAYATCRILADLSYPADRYARVCWRVGRYQNENFCLQIHFGQCFVEVAFMINPHSGTNYETLSIRELSVSGSGSRPGVWKHPNLEALQDYIDAAKDIMYAETSEASVCGE